MIDRALCLAGLVVLASSLACSRESGTTLDSAGGASDTLAETTSADDPDRLDAQATSAINLLKTLADRDETLLEIARIAVTRREQLNVSDDARRILSDQRRESNRLVGMLKGEFRVPHQPSVPAQEQVFVDTLNASGVGEFDSIFLGVVAKHHEDDVRLIDAALPKITHPQVRELVTSIKEQRAAEAASFRKRREAVVSGS